jgi:putative transposase
VKALLIIAALSTVRGWFRRSIAKSAKTRERPKKIGRPPISARVRKLVARMAIENSTWGYDRITDALGNLGIFISDQSVGNILKERGIPPAGERGARRKRWRHFIAVHWRTLRVLRFLFRAGDLVRWIELGQRANGPITYATSTII